MLRDRFGVSEPRACRVVGQHRSTQRLDPPPITDDERLLREFLRAFSKRRPRWGWRRAAKAARKAGWEVNDKRIRRLWRDEGLRVPQKRRKQPLRGIGAPVGAICRFNGRLRDELLNGRQWDSLLEARVIIEDWRIDYNIN